MGLNYCGEIFELADFEDKPVNSIICHLDENKSSETQFHSIYYFSVPGMLSRRNLCRGIIEVKWESVDKNETKLSNSRETHHTKLN